MLQGECRGGRVVLAGAARDFKSSSAEISLCIACFKDHSIVAFICIINAKKWLCFTVI